MSNKFSLSRRQALVGGASLFAAPALLSGVAHAETGADVKAKRKVVVGIQGDNPPWGFVDSSGVQQGIDSFMGRAFAEFLGVEVEFMPLAVANRIPALVTGRCDILFATMAMLPDRAKAVQFTKPYAANIIGLWAPKTTVIKDNAAMGKLKIGVPSGAVQDVQVTKNAPESVAISRFNDDAATIQAMISGQVDAVGGNQFYGERLNQAAGGDKYEQKLRFTALYNGACTRLGEKEWNETANKFIDKIKADGSLAKAYKQWMKLELPEFPASLENIPFTVGG